jgi:glucosylceramidase
MRNTLWTAVTVGVLVTGVAGCRGGGGSSLAGDVCTKAGTCGSLTGVDTNGCKDIVNQSLQSKTGAARSEEEQAINACLGIADCTDFTKCFEDALQGSSGGSGGSGGSLTGGSSGGTTNGGSGGSSTSDSGGSGRGGGSGSSVGGRGGSTLSGNTGGNGAGTGGNAAGSTGSGTGGRAGTGGATAVATEPEVMTSGQNAYWTKGQVTKVTSGTADVNVDKNTTYQRWDGFGGTFNEMGWDALQVVSAEIPHALKLLFDANEGANFVYGRIPLGASDYSMNWYTLDDSAGDYTMDKFSIARDKEKLIPFIKEALKVKPDLHLWASPWVLPSWMLSGSNIKTDAQTLKAHALYFARFIEEYAKEGMKIEAVHFQNEPGYGRVRGWTGSLFVSYVKTYMGPTFAERNVPAEIWCGTMSKDPDDTNIALATAQDADAMKIVKGFGVQWNPLAAVSTLGKKGAVMMTEHRCGNYNFEGPYWDKSRYSSSKAQNDHLYGEESWQLIRDWITAGVNSYSAWNMVLDTVGKSLDNWPQNAPLVVDRTAKKLIVTPAYHVFRHFSYYIAPGATRIGATGSGDAYKGVNDKSWNALNALAFKNPDGSIIVQVYNKGSSAKQTIVGVGSALSQVLYQFEVPGHGWATLRVPE